MFGSTAECVDVGRDPNPHLSLAYAEHYCMGAGLARLEGRIVFEELLGPLQARRPEPPVTWSAAGHRPDHCSHPCTHDVRRQSLG